MAHIDPASGQWVADDNGPPPGGVPAGSIGEQTNPALPPIQPQAPPAPPANVVKIDQPIAISAKPGEADLPPAPTPALPTPSAMPPARPQLVTSQKLTTPEQVQALQNVDQANAALRDNNAKAGDLKVQQATQVAQQADDYQALLQKQADQRTALQNAFEARKARDNELIAKAQADGLKDPNEGESWTHRLLRAIAIGLGQYSAAMNHTDNMAAKIFENDYQQKQQRAKAKIDAAKEQGKLTDQQYRDALADLDAKGAGQVAAFNATWKAKSEALGIPQARIDADANTLALDKQEAEARAKLLNEDRVTVRDETPKELKEGRPKGAGGGGRGISELVQMKQDGASPAEIQRRAEQLHIKSKDYLPVVRDVVPGGAGATKLSEEERARVVDLGGQQRLAPSTRVAKQIQDRDVQYDDAIESLQQLKAYVQANPVTGRLPVGDLYNRAALAVAATTTANASDHTTHMETGTLKNWGAVSPEAIDRTIAHIQARQQKFRDQLQDLPGADVSAGTRQSLPDKARAARAVMNGEPAPRPAAPAAARPAPPKVPDAVIERAKEEVRKNGPHAASARRLLDQQGIDVL